jgi:MFS family permease
MVQQASNLGQFVGPLMLGLWVERFGWASAPMIAVPTALLGLAAAFMIRHALVANQPVTRAVERRAEWKGLASPSAAPVASKIGA